MKKSYILLLFFSLVLASCSLDDEPSSDEVMLPIESVIVPQTMELNIEHRIMIKYKRPTTCHLFNGFYYETNNLTETIAISAVKLNESNCQSAEDEGPYEVAFKFTPTKAEVYHFKFWSGTTTGGIEEYLEYDVEVN